MSLRKCKICETGFFSKTNTIYCPNCNKSKYRKENGVNPLEKRTCLNCGELYESRLSFQKYCSRNCRNEISKKSLKKDYERDRFIIFDRDYFQCIYCGQTSYGNGIELHVDHIIPKSLGGTDFAENLVTACLGCNLGKAAMPLISIAKIMLEVSRRNKLAGIDPHQNIKLPGGNIDSSFTHKIIIRQENLIIPFCEPVEAN